MCVMLPKDVAVQSDEHDFQLEGQGPHFLGSVQSLQHDLAESLEKGDRVDDLDPYSHVSELNLVLYLKLALVLYQFFL